MRVLNYSESFSLAYLVFLELEDMHQHLDIKILDEKNNGILLISFYLQLLNKQ